MPTYTLIYFNARGRAEVARLMFKQAGVHFEDQRLEKEQWAKMKSEAPLGQLPILEVNGERIPQSMAIARYVARELSMYGDNNFEAFKIDAVLDTVCEFLDAAIKAKFSPPETKDKLEAAAKEKAEAMKKYIAEQLKKNKSGFIVGSKVSVADFTAFHFMSGFAPIVALVGDLPSEINAHFAKVANLPNVKKWLSDRPVTEM